MAKIVPYTLCYRRLEVILRRVKTKTDMQLITVMVLYEHLSRQ